MEAEDANKAGKQRAFLLWQKELCWQRVNTTHYTKATTIPGRDPDRWRSDAVGNPVLNALRGCAGPYCHEYDHIVPFSKGGETIVENCQILQTAVNRFKSNKTSLSLEQLRNASISVSPSRKSGLAQCSTRDGFPGVCRLRQCQASRREHHQVPARITNEVSSLLSLNVIFSFQYRFFNRVNRLST